MSKTVRFQLNEKFSLMCQGPSNKDVFGKIRLCYINTDVTSLEGLPTFNIKFSAINCRNFECISK
jgi:hypothetical protein